MGKKYTGPLSNNPTWKKKFARGYELVNKLNNIEAEKEDEISEVISQLLGHVGKDVCVLTPFYCNIGENIKLGRGVFVNINCVFLDTDTIEIGEYTLVGPGVNFIAADHPVSTSERVVRKNGSRVANGEYSSCEEYTFTNTMKPIKVGKRCWIGAGSIILPGVTIGDNTVIGAGSIVTKDMPSNSIAVGSPCKVIRENK